jgi:hypothetical protein
MLGVRLSALVKLILSNWIYYLKNFYEVNDYS